MNNKAARSYVTAFGASMAVYVVFLLVSIWLLKAPVAAPWRYPVAVLPVVPVAFALVAFLRFLNRMDELQRQIQLTAVGFSLGTVVMLTFTYGFLENAGLPRLSWIWIAPMAIATWGVSLAIASRRYR
jgi:hypothetical protein